MTLRATIVVNAPVDRVYGLLADVGNWPRLFRHVRHARVVAGDREQRLIEVVQDFWGMRLGYEGVWRGEPYHFIELRQRRGPLLSGTASFTLQPAAGGTCVTHRVQIRAPARRPRAGLSALSLRPLLAGLMGAELRSLKSAAEASAAAPQLTPQAACPD